MPRLNHYEIDPYVCRRCGVCSLKCPREAIFKNDAQEFVIDQTKCIRCGSCATNCKLRAVMKKLGPGV